MHLQHFKASGENIFSKHELLKQHIRFYCSLQATSVNTAFMGRNWKRAAFCEGGGVFTGNRSLDCEFVKTASLYEKEVSL
jgi:hypothetical protein